MVWTAFALAILGICWGVGEIWKVIARETRQEREKQAIEARRKAYEEERRLHPPEEALAAFMRRRNAEAGRTIYSRIPGDAARPPAAGESPAPGKSS